jgi:sporulation protein YlmC with PRC-barrel domain
MPEEVGAARESSSALVGKKVVTEAGSLLGTIGDYFIDESARRVTGLVVGGGLLSAQDGLSADRILSVGPDAVIVTDEGTEASGAGQPRSPWAGD